MTSLSSLPHFLLYLVSGLLMLLVVLAIYVRLTPQDELALIRQGNAAAAISLGGAMIGFAIVLTAAIRVSGNLLDAAVWGALALVVQLGTFLGVAYLLPGWREALEEGKCAGSVLVTSAAVAVAMINAACLTP
jgi:putative membrane protein